jgi:DNA polymerase III epsilon subunit-like protein
MDIMVDLETMGTGYDAAIVSIGAVVMVDTQRDGLGADLYIPVSLQSSMDHGLSVSAGTIMWWMEQDEPARLALVDGAVPLPRALELLTEFIRGAANDVVSSVKIWGNGATFDNVILRNAYKACGMEAPWRFWNDRCYRTLKALHPEVKLPDRGGVHHNALDDARYQAKCATLILRSMS